MGDPETRHWTVGPDANPERLDHVLARAFADLSRSRLQALVRQGYARMGRASVTEPSAKVAAGAEISLEIPAAAAPKPLAEAIALAAIYEDEDLIVIDKPGGLVVHPGAGHEAGTLVNALIAHCGDSLSGIGGVRRPGIVHRLDKDTSGLLVVAKNDRAHQGLAAQFADHGRSGPLERAYLAVAWGVPNPKRGTIDRPLARSTRNREKMAVAPAERGREARTHYAVEEVFGPRGPVASLVRCTLETGRTHQIRVHMTEIGHPLLGDALYGPGFKTKANLLPEAARRALVGLNRQALHATVLGFEHPATGVTLRFESAPPSELRALLEALAAMP